MSSSISFTSKKARLNHNTWLKKNESFSPKEWCSRLRRSSTRCSSQLVSLGKSLENPTSSSWSACRRSSLCKRSLDTTWLRNHKYSRSSLTLAWCLRERSFRKPGTRSISSAWRTWQARSASSKQRLTKSLKSETRKSRMNLELRKDRLKITSLNKKIFKKVK